MFLSVRFSSGQVERVMLVRRPQRLMDLQKDLCRTFHARFPAEMAVITTFAGKRFEDFETMPFKEVPEDMVEVLATVEFLPTDNPYFYDVRDRREKKVSLEEEMCVKETRNTETAKLGINGIQSQRFVAQESCPTWGYLLEDLGAPPVFDWATIGRHLAQESASAGTPLERRPDHVAPVLSVSNFQWTRPFGLVGAVPTLGVPVAKHDDTASLGECNVQDQTPTFGGVFTAPPSRFDLKFAPVMPEKFSSTASTYTSSTGLQRDGGCLLSAGADIDSFLGADSERD
jgi:hypothetical protein